MWVLYMVALWAMPTSVPTPQIQEMMQRIRRNAPLTDLNFTVHDEAWGMYLLFGDEREESGM